MDQHVLLTDRREEIGRIANSLEEFRSSLKLAEDARTSALNINVKTIDGGVVQLSGFAKSQQEKDVASQVARSIKGVNSVHNNLIVKP